AMEHFTAAIPLIEKAADDQLAAAFACHFGDLQVELGRYADAAATLREGAKRAVRIGDLPLHAFVLTRLGTVTERLGSFDAAVELHERALAAINDQTSLELELEARLRLGHTHLAAGRTAAAREQFERLLQITQLDAPIERRYRSHALLGLERCG